jgi:phosphoesterase RecJ-like protein
MLDWVQIINKIIQVKRVAIVSHISPDGDAIGSSLALYHALMRMDKQADIYMQDDIGSSFTFLEGSQTVLHQWNGQKYDVCITIDCSELHRTGHLIELFKNTEFTINIDHHLGSNEYANLNYINEKASSTGEIVYDFIEELQVEIDKKIAECLYVAIATDTGGFRYGCTTSKSFEIAAELLKTGIDINEISLRVFDQMSKKKAILMSAAIDSMEMFADERISTICLDYDKISAINPNVEDFDSIINIPRNIIGVEIAIFITEKTQNEVKASFRSNTEIDVNEIAGVFGGGGHKRAAGCVFKNMKVIEVKNLLVQETIKRLK